MSAPDRRSVLVIAHPGHELYVYGWLARARPLTCILTDGSGLGRPPRLARSRRVLASRGAGLGPILGRWTDREVYDALLDGKCDVFVAVARDLADLIVEQHAERVVADPAEGFNPTHDLCRLIVDAALALAEPRLGYAPARLEFPQFLLPPAPGQGPPGALEIALDDTEFESKQLAALAYEEIEPEVTTSLRQRGLDSFRRECLWPCATRAGRYDPPRAPPVYEPYGEALVRRGVLSRVIRRAHLEAVAAALAAALPAGA